MSKNTLANQRLGYPSDARLLIINADDFGMCHAINEGIMQSIREGVVSSCTLMTPCPWALHGMHLLKENPDIPFGVHLTAISEEDYYRWGPLAPKHKVLSLMDKDGYFYKENRIGEFLAQVILAELELEFRTQIEVVLAAELSPTHLDSHCLIHTRREDIFEMTARLAREYGLALRVNRPFIKKIKNQGQPANNFDLLDSYRLATSSKPDVYFKMLRELPPGLTEWALHPSLVTPELQAISSSWDVREADFNFAVSPETKRIIHEEGIIVLSYQPLQKLWEETKTPF